MARFVVDLGGIKMSAEKQTQIADEIQRAVLTHVARLDIKAPIAIKFPREWYGIILRPDFNSLPGVEREIVGFTGA